jgi:O-antigen/teichoic acid export membrane protein
MGIVRRHTIWGTLYTYIGIGIGMLNLMVLMPKFMSAEQMGLIELTNKLAMLISLIGVLGLPQALIRFMPKMPGQELCLYQYTLWISAGATAVVTIAYLLSWPWLSKLYADAPLFLEHYFYIPIFSGSLLLFLLLEGFLIARMDTLWPLFLREIALRTFTMCCIVLYAVDAINYKGFYMLYAAGHLLVLAILWMRAQRHANNLNKISPTNLSPSDKRNLWTFALFTLTSSASIYLVFILDSLMISAILGLGVVASYAVYYNMSIAVTVPARAIQRPANAVSAQYWANQDILSLKAIYTKTSLIGLWVSGLIFVCILLAEPWIKGLYIHVGKPAFAQDFPLFELLGLTAVINAAFGNNHYILHSSPKYRWDLYLNIFLLAIGFLGNLWFISLWGAWGAALASLLAMLLINLLKSGLLWHFYRLQPFSWRQGAVLALLAVAWLVASHVPQLNLWLWVPVRCVVAALIVVVPTLYWRLVPSLNAFEGVVQQRLRR